MEKHNEIMPECYIDTTLISTLLGAKVSHKNSCNEVTRAMEKGRYSDDFAVGIIDNDKREPSYTSEFEELGSTENLTFLKHKTKKQFLIKIGKPKKAMETFLMNSVSAIGMKIEDFGLPSGLKELLAVTKDSITTQMDPRILKLCKTLRSAPEVNKLKDVLAYLADKRYEADEESIKKIINS